MMKYQINRCNNDGGSFSARPAKSEVALIIALETNARIDEKMIFNFKMVLLYGRRSLVMSRVKVSFEPNNITTTGEDKTRLKRI
jgi:hypothetical protein